MALRDDLEAVRALLNEPATRVRGHTATNAQGVRVRAGDPNATSWDLNGAIHKVCDSHDRREAVFAALETEVPDRNVKAFDSDAGQTHGQVIAALARVIAATPAGVSARKER